MRVPDTLRKTVDTVVFARNLNALRADTTTFVNAAEFFDVRFEPGRTPRLLDVRGPFVEMVRPPMQSSKTWMALCAELGVADALRDAVTEVLFGGDPDAHLYLHQEQALRALLEDTEGIILSVPTATGKTESFLIALLHHCLRPARGATPLRAVVVYPTKTLEADQLNRVLRFVHAVNRWLPEGVRRLRIGIWDGDTPYKVTERADDNDPDTAENDAPREAKALLVNETVRGLECPRPECRSHDAQLRARLPEHGYMLRCTRHPTEPITEVSYARFALRKSPGQVDIIFTTPESLEHALASPKGLLRQHLARAAVKYLVYDEAHYWNGTGGTAIRQLNQRLLCQFDKPDRRLRIILASATVSDPDALFRDLTGESGLAITYSPQPLGNAANGLVLPAGLRPVPVAALAAALDDPEKADSDSQTTLAALGLDGNASAESPGGRLRETVAAARVAGQTPDEIVIDCRAFRDAWREVLQHSLATLTSALWPASDDDARMMAPWTALRQRVADALPADQQSRAQEYLEALLGYGRAAGLFVDRYHVFLVPPTGVYFSPADQRLAPNDAPTPVSEAGGLAPPLLPEVGVCSCGQPFLAIIKGVHDRWLDIEPFLRILPIGHKLREALQHKDQPGIYWPIGHKVPFGSDPYTAKPVLLQKERGVTRQRCPSCELLLDPGMLKGRAERGYGRRLRFPQPSRLFVEHLLNYLLTAAVEESAGNRALVISDGRNIAGRLAANFLRDDTSRLGVAGLFVAALLEKGPTPSNQLHDYIRGNNPKDPGVLLRRLIHDVYGAELLDRTSPILQAEQNVRRDAFLDRFRRILLDYALIVPEVFNDDLLPPFDTLAGWHLFASTTIRRPFVPLKAVAGDDDETQEEADDEDAPLFEEETAGPSVPGFRVVTESFLKKRFIKQWHDVAGLTEEALEAAFGRVFGKLVEAGFFLPVLSDTMVEKLRATALSEDQIRRWLQFHELGNMSGQPCGAFTYEPSRGDWRAAVSRSRTYCTCCGKAWAGKFHACWNCGNTRADEMAWHNPTQQPSATPTDRLGSFLMPILRSLRDGKEAPLRTVEALRAGLPVVDRARIEEAFRKGRLNVLSATTLMELGVDIGRLDTLIQHGVPPTFTNYVQRAGRVGRSQGRAACVYNVLRPDNPIDMYFFGDLEKHFFRDLAPIYIPASADAQAVAASQILSHLLAQLAQERPDEYLSHWRSPQEGSAAAILRAAAYVTSQAGQRQTALEEMLQRFGLSTGQARELLGTHLNLNGDAAEAHPGSHRHRILEFLKRAAPPAGSAAAAGVPTAAMARFLRDVPNYPMLLQSVGLFGGYRSTGEPHHVRLRFPARATGQDRYEFEERTADQLLRECFPGPGDNQPGGFFYRGTTMWRVQRMIGEETKTSIALRYCANPDCDYRSTPVLRLSSCPGCGGSLKGVKTAEPVECEATSLSGYRAIDPRVFALSASVIPVGALPTEWSPCGGLGEAGYLLSATVLHAVAEFYEGSSGEIRPSRVTVPNDWEGNEYCPGLTEQLPTTVLRLPRGRFLEDGQLAPGVIWSCFAAFRQAVGVLLRRAESDFYAGWDVDEQFVHFAVADTHSGGTGLARQWQQLLTSAEGQDRLREYLRGLAGCPHCARFCHYCLLHDRISPTIVPDLDRQLLAAGFGL